MHFVQVISQMNFSLTVDFCVNIHNNFNWSEDNLKAVLKIVFRFFTIFTRITFGNQIQDVDEIL